MLLTKVTICYFMTKVTNHSEKSAKTKIYIRKNINRFTYRSQMVINEKRMT